MSIIEMRRRLKKIDKHYSIYEFNGEYRFEYAGSTFLYLTKINSRLIGYRWGIEFPAESVFLGLYGLRILRDVLPLIEEFEEEGTWNEN